MSTTTTGRGRPRRTRRSPAEQQRLERLTAARDQLNAAAAERRRREDEALAGYAATAGEADEVIAARDVALADLDRQRQAVIDGVAAKLADIDARKTAVLAVLSELGRSADELSALFEIPIKKVRVLLRIRRRSTSAPAERLRPATTSHPGGHRGSSRTGRRVLRLSRSPARTCWSRPRVFRSRRW